MTLRFLHRGRASRFWSGVVRRSNWDAIAGCPGDPRKVDRIKPLVPAHGRRWWPKRHATLLWTPRGRYFRGASRYGARTARMWSRRRG